jgi:hypothetical protein
MKPTALGASLGPGIRSTIRHLQAEDDKAWTFRRDWTRTGFPCHRADTLVSFSRGFTLIKGKLAIRAAIRAQKPKMSSAALCCTVLHGHDNVLEIGRKLRARNGPQVT